MATASGWGLLRDGSPLRFRTPASGDDRPRYSAAAKPRFRSYCTLIPARSTLQPFNRSTTSAWSLEQRWPWPAAPATHPVQSRFVSHLMPTPRLTMHRGMSTMPSETFRRSPVRELGPKKREDQGQVVRGPRSQEARGPRSRKIGTKVREISC